MIHPTETPPSPTAPSSLPRHSALFALIHARTATEAAPDPNQAPAPDPRRPLTEAERAALGYTTSFGR